MIGTIRYLDTLIYEMNVCNVIIKGNLSNFESNILLNFISKPEVLL